MVPARLLVRCVYFLSSFTPCCRSLAGGDVAKLLYDPSSLTCADNQNDGRQRVLDTLAAMSVDTFYGPVMFTKYRQNYGGRMRVVQVSVCILHMCMHTAYVCAC